MILIVDDLPIFRDPIAACLRLSGFESRCAASAKEALEKAREHRPRLILLDIVMPGMDGLEFLREIRKDPDLADVPVLLLTAIADRERILQAARLGAREYMLKSRFSLKELVERVRRHFEPAAPESAALSRIAELEGNGRDG